MAKLSNTRSSLGPAHSMSSLISKLFIRDIFCLCSEMNIVLLPFPHPSKCLHGSYSLTCPKSSELTLLLDSVGCGDEYSGKRSYYQANNPQFDAQSQCVTAMSQQVEQETTLTSGEIAWGTYKDPNSTVPVKGHIRMNKPSHPLLTRRDTPPTPPTPNYCKHSLTLFPVLTIVHICPV